MPQTFAKHTTPFLGLAPFLRMSIAGTDLQPLCREMLAQAEESATDTGLWMNLSIAMLCLGQRDLGLAIQAQALALQHVHRIAATVQPARLRLLVLMVPGDLAANTPIECLLEGSDIDLIFYYLPSDPNGTQPDTPIPEHDAVIVAISEADENSALLDTLETVLADWPRPVINAPQNIPATGRAVASALLRDAPGLLIPPTLRASRGVLQAIAAGEAGLAESFPGCAFPIILRPIGSHAGRDLERIEGPADVADYLSRVDQTGFYLSPFIDYRGKDGLFRKMRVALIDGAAYPCHLAVSSHWMIHYVNAGMYEEQKKRDEEAAFMADFSGFAERHRAALDAIQQRTKLDYLCIDCAETADGQLLVFEIDHAMVVHAMDPADRFPYKQAHMLRVRNAFRDFLFRLSAGQRASRAD